MDSSTINKRVAKDIRDGTLNLKSSHGIYMAPEGSNFYNVHFILPGPEDTPYEGGLYHGMVRLNPEHPNAPPNIYSITPNGRFIPESHPIPSDSRGICISFTAWHPESWSPVYNLETILISFISFLCDTEHATGAIEKHKTSDKLKKEFAIKSLAHVQQEPIVAQLFPELHAELVSGTYKPVKIGELGRKTVENNSNPNEIKSNLIPESAVPEIERPSKSVKSVSSSKKKNKSISTSSDSDVKFTKSKNNSVSSKKKQTKSESESDSDSESESETDSETESDSETETESETDTETESDTDTETETESESESEEYVKPKKKIMKQIKKVIKPTKKIMASESEEEIPKSKKKVNSSKKKVIKTESSEEEPVKSKHRTTVSKKKVIKTESSEEEPIKSKHRTTVSKKKIIKSESEEEPVKSKKKKVISKKKIIESESEEEPVRSKSRSKKMTSTKKIEPEPKKKKSKSNKK